MNTVSRFQGSNQKTEQFLQRVREIEEDEDEFVQSHESEENHYFRFNFRNLLCARDAEKRRIVFDFRLCEEIFALVVIYRNANVDGKGEGHVGLSSLLGFAFASLISFDFFFLLFIEMISLSLYSSKEFMQSNFCHKSYSFSFCLVTNYIK